MDIDFLFPDLAMKKHLNKIGLLSNVIVSRTSLIYDKLRECFLVDFGPWPYLPPIDKQYCNTNEAKFSDWSVPDNQNNLRANFDEVTYVLVDTAVDEGILREVLGTDLFGDSSVEIRAISHCNSLIIAVGVFAIPILNNNYMLLVCNSKDRYMSSISRFIDRASDHDSSIYCLKTLDGRVALDRIYSAL